MTRIIYVCSQNPNKIARIKDILAGVAGVSVLGMEPREIQHEDIEEVALFKAEYAFSRINKPIIAHDSGFYIDALRGFPGSYTKQVIAKIGANGILRLLDNVEDRRCDLRASICYINEAGRVQQFNETIAGRVALYVGGARDDAWGEMWRIFVPDGGTKSLGDMTEAERTVLYTNRVWQKLANHIKMEQV